MRGDIECDFLIASVLVFALSPAAVAVSWLSCLLRASAARTRGRRKITRCCECRARGHCVRYDVIDREFESRGPQDAGAGSERERRRALSGSPSRAVECRSSCRTRQQSKQYKSWR